MRSLAPLEEYMLLDDRPEYPMVFFHKLRFSGHLNRPLLERAFHDAIENYPLLTSVACKSSFAIWKWTATKKRHELIFWTEGNAPLTPKLPFDIRVCPGVFLTAARTAAGTELLFQFNHSCCDGKDSLSFIGDVLATYAALLDSSSVDLTLQDPAAKPKSNVCAEVAFTWRDFSWVLRMPWKFYVKGLIFLTRSPVPLIPECSAPYAAPLPPDFPAIGSHIFDAAETESFSQASKNLGVTDNDLLARDLLLAIADWKQRNAPADTLDWLRFCVPVDIRRHEKLRYLRGNWASYNFLDRRIYDLHDPDSLLSGVHDEMEQVKKQRMELIFLGWLRILKMFPGVREWIIARKKCQSTCVMTNLGRVFNRLRLPRREGRIILGEVMLESIECTAPLRPLTSAAFAIHYYARRLAITLHYDPRILSKQQADDLVDTYTRFLKISMEQTMVSGFSKL